jgi:hypothetical protein
MDGNDSYADDLWEELLRQKDDAQSLEAPHPTPNPSNQSPNYIVMGCYDCPFFHIMGMGNNSGECTGKKTRLVLHKTVVAPDSCPLLIEGSITVKLSERKT